MSEIKKLEKTAATFHIIYALIWSNKSNQKSWSEIFEKAKMAMNNIDLALIKTQTFSNLSRIMSKLDVWK